MLKLTLKPGEYIEIGEGIKVIFSGGSANNIHLLVDAPRDVAIARSRAMEQKGKAVASYHSEQGISKEAQKEIVEILKRERNR